MAQMPVPTDLTPELLFYARKAAEQVFKEGYIYNKVGVMLSGFFPSNYGQMSLFDTADRVKLSTLTTAVDKINDTFGPGTIYYAGCGIKRTWKTRRDSVSPSYTTEWEEIPNASAGGLNLEDGSVAI